MKIGNIDLFKLCFIIALGIFLYLYYQNSMIGRFQYSMDGRILDTKTGETFMITPSKSGIYDYYHKGFTAPIIK